MPRLPSQKEHAIAANGAKRPQDGVSRTVLQPVLHFTNIIFLMLVNVPACNL